MLSSFIETAGVYLLKHTSFMLKNNIYRIITATAIIIVVITIIIPVTTGGGPCI